MSGRANLLYPGQPAVVPALQAALPRILQDLVPDAFRLARDHGVNPLAHFFEAHGGVDAAHDHGHPQTAKMVRHDVRSACLGGERSDPH